LRRQKRAPQFLPLELVDPVSQRPDDSSDADTVLEAALQDAIKLLPSNEQQLLQWSYFEELSQREIAASIHSTPKAVESKLARIREKLRKLLSRTLSNE